MNPLAIEDAEIRRYLLGQLDPDSSQVEQIDELILTDTEFQQRVDLMEDEIVEQYLEGDLNTIDRAAVERHFLRPPQRSARLIQRHLSAATLVSTPDRVTPPPRAPILRMRQLRIWSAIAAAVLLAACLLSLSRQHRRVNSLEHANLQLEDQNRELFARNELPPTAPAVHLNLLEPGLRRGANRFPNLDLPAGADEVQVEIALLTSSPGPYRITLLHNDAAAWTGPLLRALPVAGGGILRFDIPAIAIPDGTCAVVLKSVSGANIVYWFTVHRH
jgi:hypothetical protein